MLNAGRILIIAGGFFLLALASILMASPSALAQTMGEYGLTVNHSASAAAALPRPEPKSALQQYSAPNGGSGQSGSIRTYEVGPSSDADENDAAGSSNTGSNDSADSPDDWVKVK
jgi:hypothetical protein